MANESKSILDQLSHILTEMNKEYHLVDLCHVIHNETNGHFSFKFFKLLLDRLYPSIPIEDKVYLLKHIDLHSVGVQYPHFVIKLPMLFKAFERFLNGKIQSPLMHFYSIANALDYKYRTTTVEFIYSVGLTIESVVNVNEFFQYISPALFLDDIASIVIFKGLDYNKKGKARIEDFILVIDSYREDSSFNTEDYNSSINNTNGPFDLNDHEYIRGMMNVFIDKNYVDIDALFKDAEFLYLDYFALKSALMIEFSCEVNYGLIIDAFLDRLNKNKKIFKEDVMAFLSFEPKRSDNPKDTAKAGNRLREKRKMKLNEFQCYWLSKYIEILASANITSEMAFDLSKSKAGGNDGDSQAIGKDEIKLDDLKRRMKIFLSTGSIKGIEINYIAEAMNINNNNTITYEEYEGMLSQIRVNNQNAINNHNNYHNPENKPRTNQGLFFNKWQMGVKSTNYHLLPVKGNNKVLLELKKDIQLYLLSAEKDQKANSNNIKGNEINPSQPRSHLVFLQQEEKIIGNESANTNTELYRIKKNNKQKSMIKDQKGNLNSNRNEKDNDYKDDNDIIQSIENFLCNAIYFPCLDLFKAIMLNESFTKSKALKIIQQIDTDRDGFISQLDLMTFLLKEMKHRSTKIALRYLYILIHKELKISACSYLEQKHIVPSNEIKYKEFLNLLTEIKVNKIIIRKLYEEMMEIFYCPLLYMHLAMIIDEGKEESNLNRMTPFNITQIDFDKEVRAIVRNIIDINDSYCNSDILKIKSFRESLLLTMNCNQRSFTINQFRHYFIIPLEIDMNIGMTIFTLLNTLLPSGEGIVHLDSLITFLESYLEFDSTDLIGSENSTKIEDVVKQLETNGSSIRLAFEHILFNPSGVITVHDIRHTLNQFYPFANGNTILRLVKALDENKSGFVTYNLLQTFLMSYSHLSLVGSRKCSIVLELQFISCNVLKDIAINNTEVRQMGSEIDAYEYFKLKCLNERIDIKNFENISKREHSRLLTDLYSSSASRDELFDYLCKIQGRQDGYNMLVLCNMINSLFANAKLAKPPSESVSLASSEEDMKQLIPAVKEVEEALIDFQLGSFGMIAMADFIRRFPTGNKKHRVSLSIAIDKNRKGYIDYITFISELRNIYGNKINLSIKLCAKYMFSEFIIKWDNIDTWLLSKAKAKDLDAFISHDVAYNLFISCFGYDRILFESFYQIYKEKKGNNNGLLNLQSLSVFIKDCNSNKRPKELYLKKMSLNYTYAHSLSGDEGSEDNDDDKEPEVILSPENTIKAILNRYDAQTIPMKNGINMLNIKHIDLQTNCSISQKYYRQFLVSTLKFQIKDIDTIISFFQIENEEGRFDLRTYVEFIQINCPRSKCDITSTIIPKLKQGIEMSSINSFKAFLQKFFKADSLDIVEFSHCLELFKISLYECIVLMRREDYISINDLFTEYGLKALFKSTEIDLSLRPLLRKLSDYFESNKDKLKLFKQNDLDKNGYIAPEEFITALNSIRDIEINDKQKMSLLKIADKDKDGHINPKEFLLFIKTIKPSSDSSNFQQDENTNNSNMTLPVTQSANLPKVHPVFNKLYQNILALTAVSRTNLNYNLAVYQKVKDSFLKHMITLQEDLVDNANDPGSMEQDFLYVDEKRDGAIPYAFFCLIIKKRLNAIENDVVDRLIEFAHMKLPKSVKEKNAFDKTILYNNFLRNLIDYRFDAKVNDTPQKEKGMKVKEGSNEENRGKDAQINVGIANRNIIFK